MHCRAIRYRSYCYYYTTTPYYTIRRTPAAPTTRTDRTYPLCYERIKFVFTYRAASTVAITYTSKTVRVFSKARKKIISEKHAQTTFGTSPPRVLAARKVRVLCAQKKKTVRQKSLWVIIRSKRGRRTFSKRPRKCFRVGSERRYSGVDEAEQHCLVVFISGTRLFLFFVKRIK